MAVQTTPRTSNKENTKEGGSYSGSKPASYGTPTVDIWGESGNTTTKYNNTYGKNLVGTPRGVPVNYNLEKVNVLDDITAAKWVQIKSTIVSEYKRLSNSINADTVFTAVVSADITASGFNNLRSYTNWYNTITQAVINNNITAANFNQIVDALNLHGQEACTCNCNYCACNCNYCTCACNHCNCNCNYHE